MSDRSSRSTRPTEAIAAYRAALLRNAPADELARLAAPLDPEIIAWLDLFQASRREAIRPDPNFVRRLDQVIATAPGPTSRHRRPDMLTPLRPAPGGAINGRESSIAVRPGLPRHPRAPWLAAWPSSLSHLATAVLVLALLAGAAFAALYPLSQRNDLGLPLIAPLATPTVEPLPTDDRVLLDLTLPELPPFLAEGSIAITDYPAGGSSRELAGQKSPEVFYVARGPMSMSVEAAPQPVRVIPQQGTDSANPEQMVDRGGEITLETGALVFLPEKAIVNLLNPGPDPTTIMDLLWATESYSTEAGGASWVRVSPADSLDIVSPTRITLRQATMAADDLIAGSTTNGESVTVAAVEEEHRWQIRMTQDGGFRNHTGESIDVYVLRVESGYEAPAPATNVEVSDAANLEFLWSSDGDPEDGLSRPYGLGIDPDGNLWVSDAANDRFQVLAPDGSHLETWGIPGDGEGEFEFYSPNSRFGAPYGDVAFDAEGNIYVADTGNFRVQKFAPDRTLLLSWGQEGDGDGQFLAPSSIAVGADGVVFVSDEARDDVQMFDAEGQFLGVTGAAPSDGGTYLPAGVAVDGDGNVWVADYLGSRILSFSPSGDVLTSWGTRGSRDGQISSPNDVAVDAMGRVFVADDGNNRVQVFTRDGQFLASAEGVANGLPSRFSDAVGVAVSNDGIVYVADDPTIQALRFSMTDPG
ncbi:MAG: cell surface protein [Thermomicrobiales bacterium]|jgi:DNA-binding beta-propeller fold protein YncE|nr:cell surface protein [Thermomicrobiales bacterium]